MRSSAFSAGSNVFGEYLLAMTSSILFFFFLFTSLLFLILYFVLTGPNISHIYSDANSCYNIAFSEMKISEQHTMTKSETHLIESSNSSIRDNLARAC